MYPKYKENEEKVRKICEYKIKALILQPNLAKYNSLHYEKLSGDKQGLSSVRVNDQYRIEFEEEKENGKTIATICNITDLSNHYK